MTADAVFVGGTLHTMDPEAPRAEALAVAEGRIVAVGDRRDVEALTGPGTRRIHLEGAALLPGFNDAHVHVWKIGQLRTTLLDLRDARSLDEVYGQVSRRARSLKKGEWILGRGWNEAHLAEREGPTRDGLDRAAPDHPVLLTRTCAHVHALNSAALSAAAVEVDTPAPQGGAIDARRGVLSETALGLVQRVLPAPSVGDYERWILAGGEHLRDLGITSATDAAVDPTAHAAYRNLERAGRLPIRMNLLHLLRPDLGGTPYALPAPFVTDWLRCDTVKLFADGALSAATAAVSQAYVGRDGDRGILRLEAEEIHALGRTARQAGYRLATHAIGDRALDEVLPAYDRLKADDGAAPPPRIEHFALPSPAHVETARRLGVQVVTQPIFLRELADNFRATLPRELLDRCYPLGTLHRAHLPLAFSSDGPVVRELSPLAGVEAAATAALAQDEDMSVADALAAYTRGGAVAQADSENRGTLAQGRWADFVVLDRDPLKTPPNEVGGIRVRQTFVAGRTAGGRA